MTTERMMLGWENFAEAATITSATPAQADRGVTNVIARRIARTFMAQESSRREMSIALDLGLTYSQALARVITLTRHVLGTRGRFRIQAGNVADLGDPALHLDFLTNTLDDRITFTRASTAAYWDADGVMQFAATDTARFDHHPVTGARRGLLVEGAGTNLWSRSQEIDHGDWTKSGARVVPNVGVAPDGTTTADLLIEDGSGVAAHFLSRSYTKAGSAITYTDSLFVKPAGRFALQINADDGVGNGCYAAFDVSAGRVTTEAAGLGTPFTAFKAKIRRLRNGWYRCSLSYTTNTATTLQVAHYLTNGSTSYDGNTLSGLLMWGFQLEASAFPTSYIPTTTAAVTRSADVATIDGTDFTDWFVDGSGSMFLDQEVGHIAVASPTNAGGVAIRDGAANNYLRFRFITSTTPGAQSFSGVSATAGVTQASLSGLSTVASGQRVVAAMAFAGDDFAQSTNGRPAVADTSASQPIGLDRLNLFESGNAQLWLRHFAYFSRRLSNSTLEAMTARGATINTDFAACSVDLPTEYTFTRASGGGYVDSLGRLQGQYPAITAPIVPQTTREERVKNGGFDSDSLWTKGTGWTIGSGVATKSAGTGSNLAQTIPTVPGQVYRIRATVTRSAGSVVVDAGGTDLVTVSADGSVSQTFTATATTTAITFEADATFAGTVDNVSVTLDTGLRVPVGAGQDIKVGQLMRISPQEGTANTYMLGKVVAYDGAIVTVDVVEAAAPELISNGHFTSATTGWTAAGSASLAVASGQIEVTRSVDINDFAHQAVTTASGRIYRVDIECYAGTASPTTRVGTSSGSAALLDSAAIGRVLGQVTATGVSTYVSLLVSPNGTALWDNISVKRAHTAWIVSLAGPRFTHDPVTGAAKGLLVEDARTNSATLSQSTSGYTTPAVPTAATATDTSILDPAGTRNATLIEFTATDNHPALHQPNMTIANNEYAINSIFIKHHSGSLKYAIQIFTFGTTNQVGYADVVFNSDGSISSVTTRNDVDAVGYVTYPDGWYRVYAIQQNTTGGNQTTNRLSVGRGEAATGAVYTFGIQMELGYSLSSYQPTFGVSRSRSADVCTIEGDDFTARVRQDAGTIYVANRQATTDGSAGTNYHAVAISDGTNNEIIYIGTQYGASNLETNVVDGASGQFTVTAAAPSEDEYRRVLAYAANDFGYSINGGAATTDGSGSLPTVDRMYIGSNNGASYLGGPISRLIFWPERIADADLVAMTTSGADLDAYTIPGTLADAYAGTYDSDWLDAWVGGHAATDLGANEATLRLILAADVAYRYWRIDQYDHPGPDADPAGADDAVTLEAGYLGLWRVWQPALNPVYGFQDILEARTRVLESWSGSEDFERRDPARALTPSWDYLSEADIKIARQIMRYADTDTPMYFILDPAEADDWIESDILCRLQSLTAIEAAVFERFSMAFRLKQWA